ncbi:hypothetical protein SDC9_102636 [bioreactor metagenome]|uniref:Uncharacterized protein n=1 Tax=bioreactor metagenome TaxID=1076179 RepID=A0A645ARZ6_9ZZZZ
MCSAFRETRQLRISCKDGRTVSGDIDFRHHLNIAFFGVLNNFPYLLLRIKATVIFWGIGIGLRKAAKPPDLFLTPGPNFSKFGQAFDLDPPPFVVSEVPMEQVVFIFHHIIQVLFNLVNGKKMTGNIQHQPTPAYPGIIGNFHLRNLPGNIPFGFITFNLRRQKLQERLNTVQQPGRLIGVNPHFTRSNRQSIPFVANFSVCLRIDR